MVKWLADGHSPSLSGSAAAQRAEFVQRFPWQTIGQLKLEDYALGLGNENSFSRWLEHGTIQLGRLGGDSLKHGVFRRKDSVWRFPKEFANEQEAFETVRTGLQELARAASEGRFDEIDDIGYRYLGHKGGLRFKPLYLWFPDEFVPITSYRHLEHFLKVLGLDVPASFTDRNRAWHDL